METNQPISTPAAAQVTVSNTGLFGTKIPASAAFIVAILLFFLPFAEVKCNNSPLANNTGVGLAMGTEWKEVVSRNLFGDSFGRGNDSRSSNESALKKQDANVFAIAALGLALLGLLLALLAPLSGGKVNLVVALLAAASLIAMLVDLKSKVKSDNSIKSSEFNVNADMSISVDGTPAFYFAVLLLVLAGIFCNLRANSKLKT
ncbi:MAG TPA: hypothetical protein VGC95_05125 [Chitinophagaceae bacterium]